MQRALLLAAALLCAACPRSGSPKVEPPPVLDPGRAKIAALEAVKATYDAMTEGAIEPWGERLADDALMFGSAPSEAYPGKAAIVHALHEQLDPVIAEGVRPVVEPTALEIGLAPDGRAAWVSDRFDYVIPRGTQRIGFHFRMTMLVVEDGGAWKIAAAHLSVGVPNAEAMRLAAAGELAPLPDVGGGLAPGAEPLPAALANLAASFSEREDAFLFGSDPEERLRGGMAIKELVGSQWQDGGTSITPRGALRGALAPSGTVGWVAGNVDFTVTVPGGEKVTQPYRMLLVCLREGEAWKVVQAHFSNGVPDPA
jgi:ketosteroid isomerase-like protein